MRTLLAADVGGTKTVCGLYGAGERRPDPLVVERFTTLDHDSLEALLATFLERRAPGATVDAAVLGVAGPVRGGASNLTNVPWRVEAAGRRRTLRHTRGASPQRPGGDGPRRIRAGG